MTDNPRVNRYLKDKVFDHMDHALGRPMFPFRETYRNYFAVEVGSDAANTFDASDFWTLGGIDGTMAYFHVTGAGKRALVEHLSEHDRHHAFVVTWDGHSETMPALSASKAKYEYFLRVKDAIPDIRFIDFSRTARVRRAA